MTPIPSEYLEISDMQRVFSRMGAMLSNEGRREYCRAVVRSIYDLRFIGGHHYRPGKSGMASRRVHLLINSEGEYDRYWNGHDGTILSIYLSDNNEIHEMFNGPASRYPEAARNNRVLPTEELAATSPFEPGERVRRRKVNEARPYLNSTGEGGHGSGRGNQNGGNNGNGANSNNGGPGGNGNGNGGNGGNGGGGPGAGGGDGRGGLVEVISHPVLFSVSADDYAAILDRA